MWSANRRPFAAVRALAGLAILILAAPAAAQPYRAISDARDAQAAAGAQAARSRDIAITNELAMLQARLQSDQALSNLQAQRGPMLAPPVALPPAAWQPHAVPPVIEAGALISIPDAALAQSNARIRAAAANRH